MVILKNLIIFYRKQTKFKRKLTLKSKQKVDEDGYYSQENISFEMMQAMPDPWGNELRQIVEDKNFFWLAKDKAYEMWREEQRVLYEGGLLMYNPVMRPLTYTIYCDKTAKYKNVKFMDVVQEELQKLRDAAKS